MAVFRIERTRDYTVMSNHHLRNHELSLKAKGLLSMMLSLPDDWNLSLIHISAAQPGGQPYPSGVPGPVVSFECGAGYYVYLAVPHRCDGGGYRHRAGAERFGAALPGVYLPPVPSSETETGGVGVPPTVGPETLRHGSAHGAAIFGDCHWLCRTAGLCKQLGHHLCDCLFGRQQTEPVLLLSL